jgi:hypothetical protein
LLLALVTFGCGWVFWLQIVTPSAPFALSRAAPPAALLNVPTILGESIDTVNEQLGEPLTSDTISAGTLRSIPSGGTATSYVLENDAVVDMFFDQQDTARGLAITLGEGDYTLDDRRKLLADLGLSYQRPDRTAPAAIYWDDLEGYDIAVTGSMRDREAHLVNVSFAR